MAFSDPHHPVWRIGYILAITILVFVVNWANAKQFDADDYSRIAQILGGFGLLEGGKSVASSLAARKEHYREVDRMRRIV